MDWLAPPAVSTAGAFDDGKGRAAARDDCTGAVFDVLFSAPLLLDCDKLVPLVLAGSGAGVAPDRVHGPHK